ncbi:VOC family protein [Paraburkholderia sp. BR14320]|uniref:VOC family protein n=1 Tax=unclassified Paraburkholderia TaxID=2615204 RepID=UPI0034CE4328
MYKAHLMLPPVRGLRLNNVALAVSNLSAMVAWYESRLGFVVSGRGRFDAEGADYAILEAAGLRIELVARASAVQRPVDRTTPPDHLAVLGLKAMVFETDDLEATTALLEEHRVDMVWADQPLSAERRSTMLRDPEGNLIHIFGPLLDRT